MSKELTISTGTAPVQPAEQGLVNSPLYNWGGGGFDVKSCSPNEAVILDVNTPITCPTFLKSTVNRVSNIYDAEVLIPSVNQSSAKMGMKVYNQRQEVWSITDPDHPEYQVLFPVSFSTSITIPLCDLITNDQLTAFINRGLGSLYNYDPVSKGYRLRVLDQARGLVKPQGVC